MKAFHCDQCGNLLFFENVHCVRCDHALGFLPDIIDLSTLEPAADRTWQALAPAARRRSYKQCANGLQHQVCNWLVPAEDPNQFCLACRLNEVIPDLSVQKNRELWQKLDALNAGHSVQWRWVKGHSGDPGNERADRLANKGVDLVVG